MGHSVVPLINAGSSTQRQTLQALTLVSSLNRGKASVSPLAGRKQPSAAAPHYAITTSCQRRRAASFTCQSSVTAIRLNVVSSQQAATHNVNATNDTKVWDAGLSEHRDLCRDHRSVHRASSFYGASPCTESVWVQGGRRLTHEHHYTPGPNSGCRQIDSNAHKQQDTHHITNGGDVSDSHLVYSVPLAAIFIK